MTKAPLQEDEDESGTMGAGPVESLRHSWMYALTWGFIARYALTAVSIRESRFHNLIHRVALAGFFCKL